MNASRFVGGVVLVVFLAGAPFAHAQHAGDIWVGRTDAGQLRVAGYDINQVVLLSPVSGILNGWTDSNPGLDHVSIAEPGNDLYPLSSGVTVRLEIASITPAFRYIDDGFNVYDAVGEGWNLPGGALLHEHPIWHINSDDGAFDPLRTLWPVTYVLRDMGSTGYADSAPFVVRYANIDCTTGDVNGDGTADPNDETDFYDVLNDPASATAEERCAADVNLDGLVTGDDVDPFLDLVGLGGDVDGDFDSDGDVDLSDFAQFSLCFGGANVPPAASCPAGIDADFDDDGDVDLGDFATFSLNFTGPL